MKPSNYILLALIAIESQKAHIHIKGWDGFVGDVPKDVQTQLNRDAKLNQIL